MKIVAIIQARNTSSRLPGKGTVDICGKSAIERVIERVKQAKKLDHVCVAIPFTTENNLLRTYIENTGTECILGPEVDVLDRYIRAAKITKAEVIVRLTADNVMIDPDIIDLCIEKMFFPPGGVFLEYVGTGETWPDGLDTEVIRYEALKYADIRATGEKYREHVTLFTRQNSQASLILDCEPDLGKYRWTLDRPQDLEFMRKVIPMLPENYRYKDVLSLLDKKPELCQINAGIRRNEGL